MALTLESVVGELDGGRRRPGRDVQGDQPRLAHGRPGQLGRDPVADPAGPRRRVSRGATRLDGPTLRRRARRPRPTAAYGAVMRPVEGTILTVVREAAEAAEVAAGEPAASLVAVVDAAASAGRRRPGPHARAAAGARAGRRGRRRRRRASCCSSTRCSTCVDGRPLPEPGRGRRADVAGRHATTPTPATSDGDVGDLRYEVMYFLEAPDEAIPAFKDVWAGIGDSIVVVGGDGHLELPHPHRRHRRRHRGRPRLRPAPQHPGHRPASSRSRRSAGCARAPRRRRRAGRTPSSPWRPPWWRWRPATACGASSTRSACSAIVTGGQSMNPSTARAARGGRGRAGRRGRDPPEQQEHHPGGRAGRRPDRRSRCGSCPTRGVAEGVRRAGGLRPRGRRSTTTSTRWRDGGRAVVAGEVTRAVRDSTCDAGPIAEGDWLGHRPRAASASVDADLAEAACGAARRAASTDDHEIVTLIEGEGASPATPGGSPSGWPSTAPTSRPRSTTAASRSTRTSSASSSARRGAVVR